VIDTTNGGKDIVLNVSSDHADAWKRGGIAKLAATMRADGITVFVKCGARLDRL